MAISDRIAALFQLKQSPDNQPQLIIQNSKDAKQEGETYVYYGTRICGRVTASLPALSAFLPRIFNIEKQRQIEDERLQEAHRIRLQQDLDQTVNDITLKQADVTNIEHKITDLNNSIEEQRKKLIDEQARHGELNKMANVKLRIGLVIISILTLYLFIFYSSTFYSAFFKEFDSGTNVGDAMFDPQAVPNAFSSGLGELLFILCAPIMFMGLGYSLHFFMQQESWTKYLKSGSVLAITFIFDSILAYLIAEKIYVIQSMTRLGDVPEFNIAMAIQDVNVWAVIFCGFIAYMIWGVVFDMTLTAYEDIRSNLKEIKKVEDGIKHKQESRLQEMQRLTVEKAKLESLQNKQKALINSLSKNIHYDTHVIKAALSDFFSGWMTMMNGLNRSRSEQDEANRIFTTAINQLFG